MGPSMPRTTARSNPLSAVDMLNRRIGEDLAAEYDALETQELRRLGALTSTMRARFDDLGSSELVLLFEYEHTLAKLSKARKTVPRSEPTDRRLALMSPAQRKAHQARELADYAKAAPERHARAERKQAKRRTRWEARAEDILAARPIPVPALVDPSTAPEVGIGDSKPEKGREAASSGLARVLPFRRPRVRAYSVSSHFGDDDDD